ncbi:HAMP domain-containing protein, partial [Nocardioides sp. SYSU DS0663]|uniref:HAMP domain-containing protein n=1 Tax=Nocardioides sp. SYSU DS0663 TaxID=3416445 RepID=UPI003F4B9175
MVLTAVVALVVGVTGLRSLSASADQAESLHDENVLGIVAAGEMDNALQSIRQHARDVLIGIDEAAKHEAMDDVAADVEAFESAAARYQEGGLKEDRVAAFEGLQDAVAGYVAAQHDHLFAFGLADRKADWYRANEEFASIHSSAAKEHMGTLVAAETAAADRAAAEVRDSYTANRTFALLLLTLGIGLALLVGWLVARAISRNVAKVKDVTDAMAEGDLTRRAELSTRDEVGAMGASLDAATAKLRDLMTSVIASSDAVAAAAEELSASSQQIAAGAEETSVQAGVVSGAADEVSRNVQTVAAGAEQMGASIRE